MKPLGLYVVVDGVCGCDFELCEPAYSTCSTSTTDTHDEPLARASARASVRLRLLPRWSGRRQAVKLSEITNNNPAYNKKQICSQ